MGRLNALALVLAIQVGCAPRLVDPIRWTPIERYSPAPLEDLVAVDPVALLAGDPSPFDGWVLTPADWSRIKAELRRAADAAADCYGQVDDDRAFCSLVDAAQDEALRTCREGTWRAYGAGVGTGAAACGAIGFGLNRIP